MPCLAAAAGGAGGAGGAAPRELGDVIGVVLVAVVVVDAGGTAPAGRDELGGVIGASVDAGGTAGEPGLDALDVLAAEEARGRWNGWLVTGSTSVNVLITTVVAWTITIEVLENPGQAGPTKRCEVGITAGVSGLPQ